MLSHYLFDFHYLEIRPTSLSGSVPQDRFPARRRLRVSGGWMPIVFCIERRPLSPINPTEGFPSHPYRSL
jgi:hypothetical protein